MTIILILVGQSQLSFFSWKKNCSFNKLMG